MGREAGAPLRTQRNRNGGMFLGAGARALGEAVPRGAVWELNPGQVCLRLEGVVVMLPGRGGVVGVACAPSSFSLDWQGAGGRRPETARSKSASCVSVGTFGGRSILYLGSESSCLWLLMG